MRAFPLLLIALTLSIAAPIRADPTPADFTVLDIRMSTAPGSTLPGHEQHIEIDVQNIGGSSATGFVTLWAETVLAGVEHQNTIDREHFTLAAGATITVVFAWTPVGAGDGVAVAESFTEFDADLSNDRHAEAFSVLLDGDGQGLFLR